MCGFRQPYASKGAMMDIHVVDRNVQLTSVQHDNLERCLHFALDRFASLIRTVDVSFSDVNGPKGGEDVLCRMKIGLQGMGPVIIQGTGCSVDAVAAETADRAAMTIARRQSRLRDVQTVSMSGQ